MIWSRTEPHQAQQIVDEVPADNPAVCAAVERALFPRIVDKPTTRVGQLTRKAVAAADPAATAQKAEQAQQGRFVSAGPSGLPGLMRLEAEVEAGKGRQVWAAIEELAASYIKEGVATTVDQARADAFVDLVLANASVTTVVDLAVPAGFAAAGPEQGASCADCGQGVDFPADRWAPRGRAHAFGDIQADDFRGVWVRSGGSLLEDAATGVLVDADQATGQDRASGQGAAGEGFLQGTRHDGSGSGPPTLVRDGPVRDVGHGNVLRLLAGLPIAGVLDHRVCSLNPATIERILADPDTVFRRLVIDPDTGWLLDVGATTYQPGRHLARTVRKRDLHCRFPGCSTAARFCDLDHVTPFPVGLTVLPNLACLCRRHHRLKTHSHWSLTMDADGVCTWVDRRTGQVHTTEPADYRELAV